MAFIGKMSFAVKVRERLERKCILSSRLIREKNASIIAVVVNGHGQVFLG